MEKAYFVYLLTNKHKNVLYVGITNNLAFRVWTHKNKLREGFTSKYNVNLLVYYEIYSNPSDAITREREIKKWRRQKKDILINQMNPTWKDLYEEIC